MQPLLRPIHHNSRSTKSNAAVGRIVEGVIVVADADAVTEQEAGEVEEEDETMLLGHPRKERRLHCICSEA
jgi:hypothetical protein